MDEISRRGLLRLAGSAGVLPVLAQLSAACGGAPEAEGAPTAATVGANATKVKLGFIALTDNASIEMAKELGYFADRGLDVTLEKQASWPVTKTTSSTTRSTAATALPLLDAGLGGHRRGRPRASAACGSPRC